MNKEKKVNKNEELNKEAILCEDCIYYESDNKYCPVIKLDAMPTFFCAYGNGGMMEMG